MMRRRQRKLNIQRLRSRDGPASPGGCLLTTPASVYRKLGEQLSPTATMDSELELWEPPRGQSLGDSIHQHLGGDGFFHAFDFYTKGHRLAKSESEDSGVELASGEASPSTPSEAERSFQLETDEEPRGPDWPGPGSAEAEWAERGLPPVNAKLEQAMQRSKKYRPPSGRAARRPSCAALSRRRSESLVHSASLPSVSSDADALGGKWRHCRRVSRAPEARRATAAGLGLQERDEERLQEVEVETDDPMVLPGCGLRYLEHVCQVLEQMAELQRTNRSLRRQKQAMAARLHGTGSEQVLGTVRVAASPPEAVISEPRRLLDPGDPQGRTRISFRERSMSTSDVGNLWDFAAIHGKGATPPAHFVSTPDLQDVPDGWSPSNPLPLRCKSEPSQWERVKELIGKIARKAVGPGPPSTTLPRAPSNRVSHSREDTVHGSQRALPRKAFLPAIIVKKQKKRSPPVQ
ncbi:uncharacterized protein C8orf58 homolog [Ambystoma mexicanum]|uniref:uncharacterized protein C8orf58 homolog n=1 Tax=Ambystoma mexicanum TaxID=8296 RepID=UPI0037E9820A